MVKAYDEVENPRIQRTLPNGHFGWRTDSFSAPKTRASTRRWRFWRKERRIACYAFISTWWINSR